ncbi:MAG: hypothetical protein PHG27_08215 [Massilibacteroides sp.]|nr:hypothetical protein [Massilibacteroides sp.]MDD3063982.1 hypothetical protein [Massilibacteroides sp.]MDD4115559.1 hypothetical protein [Massilibacteroides sp.]MDD4661451.1 hypothetical protein [Massilibacteroides sp.]
MPDKTLLYPRKNDKTTVYLKNCVKSPFIEVGDYSFYHDFDNPLGFEKKCVLYHYLYTNNDRLIIGSRAIVTKNVEPFSIVGGVPAKLIRKRFSKEKIQKLINLKWWDWEEETIKQKLPEIMNLENCN